MAAPHRLVPLALGLVVVLGVGSSLPLLGGQATAASRAAMHPTVSGEPYTPHPTTEPTPTRLACGRPSEHSVSASPESIRSGDSTLVTVIRRLEPCYPDESQSHLVELYARVLGSSDQPTVAATGRTDSTGRVQFTLSPSSTTDYSDVSTFPAFANGPRTVRVVVDGVNPTPTPTPHSDCRAGARVVLDRPLITAGESVGVTVTDVPGTAVDLYAYTRPSTTYHLVRSGTTDAGGIVAFAVSPPANTRLRAVEREEDCVDPSFGEEPSVALGVAPSLSLTARRNGPRDYTFAGRVMPAAQRAGTTVSLYRRSASGQRVLTAQAVVATDGTYAIRRTFTGAGRFDFFLGSGQDLTHAAGVSRVRSTLVY